MHECLSQLFGVRAAFAVGYASVQQFTREYGRMFGLPPMRDIEVARHVVETAA